MKEYLVVGAGISGATVARRLAESRSCKVTVIDSSDHLAGNCYDYRDETGIMIHMCGSHIFHTDDQAVWQFLNRFTDFNTYVHKVVAIIEGEEVPLPFNLNSLEKTFPGSLATRVEEKLLSRYGYGEKIPILDFMQQEDDDLRFLASYIYEKVFLHYTEKQWGTVPSMTDGTVTARVPVYISRDDRYFQSTYQGIPRGGYAAMIGRMLDLPNIEVRLNTPFAEIGDISCYEKVFFSGAIDELMDYSRGDLPYRSVRFKLETYDKEHYQSGAVVNYPNDHDFTRIHEYKYYQDDRSDKTVIAKEYPEDFVPGKNERHYPVPGEGNELLYQRYLEDACSKYPNMYFMGRLGDYRYYDMDKAVKRALEIVSSLQ